jgi:hypothetical protein
MRGFNHWSAYVWVMFFQILLICCELIMSSITLGCTVDHVVFLYSIIRITIVTNIFVLFYEFHLLILLNISMMGPTIMIWESWKHTQWYIQALSIIMLICILVAGNIADNIREHPPINILG